MATLFKYLGAAISGVAAIAAPDISSDPFVQNTIQTLGTVLAAYLAREARRK